MPTTNLKEFAASHETPMRALDALVYCNLRRGTVLRFTEVKNDVHAPSRTIRRSFRLEANPVERPRRLWRYRAANDGERGCFRRGCEPSGRATQSWVELLAR